MHAANLQAWYHCAVQRAECRSAPTEEICCLGCCCRRCIGLPAAFRRPKVRLVPRKAKEASSDTESTTSLSSDEESDAPMAPQAPAQRPEVNFVQGEVSDRTLYCGNLGGEASVADVREAFQQRFRLLPAFQEKYLKHGVSHVVVQVNMGKGRGNFAFITFFDPQLASTALLFNGMSLCGRRLVITWPMDYTPPHDGALPGLDVAPLRRLGMLPQAPRDRRPDRPDRGPDLGKAARATSKARPKPKSLRHIFIGNMPEGQDSMQEVSELVTCFCSELPSFRQELGPAMLGAAPRGGGWLVEMQSPELAMEAARCLREVILSGRTLSVYLTFGRDLDISSAGG
ncbi:unnamed protein product [Effrenium voratum]|uniref:RRM domain-containing protein n=1 Tax=Effrenium voratum TaxID=2562239 RepID=A0AA36IUI8_9DINO|nr:unnamed protein product [Effrenium voratum]